MDVNESWHSKYIAIWNALLQMDSNLSWTKKFTNIEGGQHKDLIRVIARWKLCVCPCICRMKINSMMLNIMEGMTRIGRPFQTMTQWHRRLVPSKQPQLNASSAWQTSVKELTKCAVDVYGSSSVNRWIVAKKLTWIEMYIKLQVIIVWKSTTVFKKNL